MATGNEKLGKFTEVMVEFKCSNGCKGTTLVHEELSEKPGCKTCGFESRYHTILAHVIYTYELLNITRKPI